ncbi:hypothetical protein CKO28_06195 [Rhodovibrio sodomensis]|uniref:Uncharacterized protein n=1 Tax=Rhodovibrio sodomensis TaxID=1088 RepID=A0ABS1DDE8_9PROT|nr:hypothetical protein [Rhodovibrio sodomensis]MBK1667623.1 hypothetical protein [Rhodovibrio sodomensis]
MTGFLYVLAGIVALVGLFGTIGVWPESSRAPAIQYAIPLGLLLNSAIMAGILAGLGLLIEHVAAIRGRLSAGAGSTGTAASAATHLSRAPGGEQTGRLEPSLARASQTTHEDGVMFSAEDVDGRGMTADGRCQVFETYQVRQREDGCWWIETRDGELHPEFKDGFTNLGQAKRSASGRL